MLTIEATEFHDALTLRELAERYRNLMFKCNYCGRSRRLDLSALVASYGGETRLGYVRRNSTCDQCG